MRGFGNLIIVDHGSEYLSIYGNNQALLKRVGDAVKGGDQIANAGNTGGGEDSGLYFELRHRGAAFNPASWVGLVAVGVAAGFAATLQFSAHAQKPGVAPLPLEELRQLADVYGLIKSDYVEPVQNNKLLSEAISGMVASLDPHSAYLDKQAYREMNDSMQGRFVGVGIEVALEDGYVKVITPLEASPAFRAGLRPGDTITRIDSMPVKGLSLDEAIKKMRGEVGSKVTLTVVRQGDKIAEMGRSNADRVKLRFEIRRN
eukprot:gene26312-47591_t